MHHLVYPRTPDAVVPMSRATSRPVWWLTCLICVGLIVFRLPSVITSMETTVADHASSENLDPSLVTLSVRIAAYLGVILFAAVIILYLSFASLLELKVLPYGRPLGKSSSIGLFCLLIAVLMISKQVFAFATGSLPEGPLEIFWVISVAAALPLLYRGSWSGTRTTTKKKVMLFVLSIGVALLVSLL